MQFGDHMKINKITINIVLQNKKSEGKIHVGEVIFTWALFDRVKICIFCFTIKGIFFFWCFHWEQRKLIGNFLTWKWDTCLYPVGGIIKFILNLCWNSNICFIDLKNMFKWKTDRWPLFYFYTLRYFPKSYSSNFCIYKVVFKTVMELRKGI